MEVEYDALALPEIEGTLRTLHRQTSRISLIFGTKQEPQVTQPFVRVLLSSGLWHHPVIMTYIFDHLGLALIQDAQSVSQLSQEPFALLLVNVLLPFIVQPGHGDFQRRPVPK
jgi:hypothetical protein